MKIPKTSGVEGKWIKVGQDIKDQDRLKILDAGILDTEGKFGARRVFKILTIKKQEFIMSFNQTSLNNLVDGFGEESENWAGKVVKAFVVRQMVGDALRNVCYLAPENWTMDDDGQFGPKEKQEKTEVHNRAIDNVYPKDDIDDSNIPF